MSPALEPDPRMTAGFDMLRRTGARTVGLRYQDDDEPTVWIALAEYRVKDGRPVSDSETDFDGTYYDTDAAMNPVRAVLRLCERMCDGSTCTHCQRPVGLDPDSIDTMPLDELVCWYQYDPELRTFRRGCEGDKRDDDEEPDEEEAFRLEDRAEEYGDEPDWEGEGND